MEGTLVVAILALLVAFGGLALGVANHFHLRKTEELSYEQRKQETHSLLYQAEKAIIFCETKLDFDTSPGFKPEGRETMREQIVELRGFLGELGGKLIEPEMTRIQLEEHHRRSLNYKATAEALEALLREW